MSDANTKLKGKGVLILNNLSLGASGLSTRTDNVLSTKLKKLKWALRNSEMSEGILLLTGKVFDKINSFSDLALIIQQDILRHPRVYIVADHPSYHINNDLSEKTIMGVINSIYPGKVIFDHPIVVGEEITVLPRVSWPKYTEESIPTGMAYLVDNSKRIRDLSTLEHGNMVLATNRGLAKDSDREFWHKLQSSVRLSVSDNSPLAYWITVEGRIEEIIIPHESSVFREDIVRDIDTRDSIRSAVELTITEAFDPRKSPNKSGENNFTKTLDEIYNKSQVSKTAYDIIMKIYD